MSVLWYWTGFYLCTNSLMVVHTYMFSATRSVHMSSWNPIYSFKINDMRMQGRCIEWRMTITTLHKIKLLRGLPGRSASHQSQNWMTEWALMVWMVSKKCHDKLSSNLVWDKDENGRWKKLLNTSSYVDPVRFCHSRIIFWEICLLTYFFQNRGWRDKTQVFGPSTSSTTSTPFH